MMTVLGNYSNILLESVTMSKLPIKFIVSLMKQVITSSAIESLGSVLIVVKIYCNLTCPICSTQKKPEQLAGIIHSDMFSIESNAKVTTV